MFVYVWVSMCMYIYMHVCIYAHLYVYVRMQILGMDRCVYIYVRIFVCMYVLCMHVHVIIPSEGMNVYLSCVCKYLYVCACMSQQIKI